ncbi:hypothetical protein SV7mr_33130 [Stieleria bergensis]|uniref:Stage II sporulation protein M n=1 Tax=Stieleria bergensis TaxID=2528025 RepID=A0A517SXB7_9BACT|nr:hypothetical protein SV7mr_33130 [Planctomycetes bacterium SV_7m_r]
MNVAKLLEKRRKDWNELERFCEAMEVSGKTDKAGPQYRGAQGVMRFSSLYRAACADLALADAYQLPPNTVTYLHRLVARAHNQLYRTESANVASFFNMLIHEAPRRIFSDNCVRVAALIFYGLFALAMFMGMSDKQFPGFAEAVCGTDQLEATSANYSEFDFGRATGTNSVMAGFYIRNNTQIGLQCFALGMLVIPAIFVLAYNAVVLGSVFGYMVRDGVGGTENFLQFVTAHGPLELTAIALSAGAGLRIGMGVFYTEGLDRVDSIRRAGKRAVPIISAAAMMFILAAFTEGFLSPSGAPYIVKVGFGIFSAMLISLYFVVLGFPRTQAVDQSLRRSVRFGELRDEASSAQQAG